jgi:primosomal protein N' (replication factor Y)
VEKRIAEVTVPRDIERTFDYLIPEELRAQASVGVRVRVPFRGEKLTAFLMNLKSESTYSGKLHELDAILDPYPVLDDLSLRLACWIGEYYLCPLGLVLQAMVPSLVRPRTPRTRSYVHLVAGLTETLRWIESLARSAPQQSALLQALLALESEPPVNELLAHVGCSQAPLQSLEERGLIAIERRPVAPARIATEFHEEAFEISLTAAQQSALEEIRSGLKRSSGRYLLHGVNASGKTEIYMQSVQQALELGKQAIVIVPEISLTPQLIARFRSRFQESVAVYHSQLTESQRAREWQRLKDGEAQVAIGVRAAIFAPLERLGLIIVDEEHEPTFKQDDPAPRYHAREAAFKRAELSSAVVVLGSATPSVESYWRAKRGGLQLLELKERVVSGAAPKTTIVDLEGEERLISSQLKQRIAQRLKSGEQVLLLLNLRGFARCVLCRNCRTTQKCPRCQITLVYHLQGQRLHCHYCGQTYPVGRCRSCSSGELVFLGAGTEQAELALRETFSGATVARMDSDSVRRGQHGAILEHFRRGEIQILLGTQMIGLGLDFPNVTLVGVLLADTLLDLPDFRAGERTFQLISQAVGRAGRGERLGEVIIQTNHPDHYAVAQAAEQDYQAFYEEELIFRKALNYPPFSHLIKLTCQDRKEERAEQHAQALHEKLVKASVKGSIEVLGPFKALPYRVRGEFRWQIVLKTKDVPATNALIRGALEEAGLAGQVKADVDPQSLMV